MDVELVGNINPEIGSPDYSLNQPSTRIEIPQLNGVHFIPLSTENQGQELFTYDVATDNLTLFAEFGDGEHFGAVSMLTQIIDGQIYFGACQDTRIASCRGLDLVRTTGTLEQLEFVTSGFTSQGLTVQSIYELGGLLVFERRNDSDFGTGIYSSSGTPGTEVLLTQNLPPLGSNLTARGQTTQELIFYDNSFFYQTDGTVAGTHAIADANLAGAEAFIGDRYLFASNQAGVGEELFRILPGGAGIELIADIYPGPTGSDISAVYESGDPNLMATTGTCHYFFAESPDFGREIWCTKGTSEETFRVTDIAPGSASATTRSYGHVFGDNLAIVEYDAGDDMLWIISNDGIQSQQILGPVDRILPLGRLVDELLFYVVQPDQTAELWITDGTPAGTRTVMTFHGHAGIEPLYHGMYDGKALLGLSQANMGRELYTTDGTEPGTQLLADLIPGPGSSFPKCLIDEPGLAFCVVDDSDGNPRLWRFRPDLPNKTFDSIGRLDQDSHANDFVGSGGYTYFAATSADTGWEPWINDPAVEQAELAHDLVPGPDDSDVYGFSSFADHVVLLAQNVPLQIAPNGALDSFQPVPTGDGSNLHWPVHGIVAGDNYYVAVLNATGTGRWLTSIDSATLTANVIMHQGSTLSSAGQQAVMGDHLLVDVASVETGNCEGFYVHDSVDDTWDLWLTGIGRNNAWPSIIPRDQDILHLARQCGGPDNLHQLFTQFDHDGNIIFQYMSPEPSNAASLYDLGDYAIIAGEFTLSSGRGVTVVDRVIAVDLIQQTAEILLEAEERFGIGQDYLGELAILNSKLLFPWEDENNDIELWTSDGTAAGTMRLKDIAPGLIRSAPHQLVTHHQYAYFTAKTFEHGREIWRTDGTSDGTTLVADIVPGPTSSDPEHLTFVGDYLYFSARIPGLGREPHRIHVIDIFSDSFE